MKSKKKNKEQTYIKLPDETNKKDYLTIPINNYEYNSYHIQNDDDSNNNNNNNNLPVTSSSILPSISAINNNNNNVNINIKSKNNSINSNSDSNNNNNRSTRHEINAMTMTLFVTIFLVVMGSSFQFGFGTGVLNNCEHFIRKDFIENKHKDFQLDQWSTVVSFFGLGGLLGASFVSKYCMTRYGRKTTLIYVNFLVLLSSGFISWAHEWYMMAMGRIMIGIVAGVVTTVVPTYFSEISPIIIRGAIGTTHQLGITLGILISQIFSTPSLHLFGNEKMWPWLFSIPAGLSIIQILFLPFLPESPPYLYAKKGRMAARDALILLQEREGVEYDLDIIEKEISHDSHTSKLSVIQLFQDKKLRKQLFVGIIVQLSMQFSGIDAVFYYSTKVFIQADIQDPFLATTILGFVNVIVTIIAMKYMDTSGRRYILLLSWTGMCFSYLLLSFSFIFQNNSNNNNENNNLMNNLSILGMTGVIIFFAFGPGCIAWFYISEIFPYHAKSTAMTIGITINWIANWFVAFSFPFLLDYMQEYTFLVFALTTFIFFIFTLKYLPETRQRTLSEVTTLFEEMKLP